MKKLLFAALAALMLAGIGGTIATPADAGVIPPQQADYGQLGANWWTWADSIPYSQNPIVAPSGKMNCNVGQQGNVWFLAETSGGSADRSCAIPRGKDIFFPLITYNNTYPCPDPSFQPAPGQSLADFLTDGAKAVINDVGKPVSYYLHANLDGIDLPIDDTFRGTSSMYTFVGNLSLAPTLDPCITRPRNYAVSDGYWLLLAPLSPGSHILSFSGSVGVPPYFSTSVTYQLTVA